MEINLKKYKKTIEEFETIETDLQKAEIISNPQKLQDLSQRHSDLQEIYTLAKYITKKHQELKDNEQILDTDPDEDMRDLISQENKKLTSQITKLIKEYKTKSTITDPNANRDIIIEIRAGTGGEEAALFAADLFRMYSRYAESKGWQVQVLSSNYTGNNGFKEIISSISGKGAYGKLRYENGVHRVQRIPSTESSGRIHTSAASVVVLPQVDDIPEIEIKDQDIKIDVYRATGPGGQSVNTTDSAVRITHLKTGIVVTCQDEKSQHKNKARALSILKSKLYQIKQEELSQSEAETRKAAIKSGDRSAKIRTYNFPQSRITDHRIKTTWHNLQEVLDGELDEIISQTHSALVDESDT